MIKKKSIPGRELALCLGIGAASLSAPAYAEPPKPATVAAPTEAELVAQADKLVAEGQPAKAIPLYTTVTKKNLRSLAAWRGLANAHRALKKPADELKALEHVIALDAKDREARLVVGRSQVAKKKLADAAKLLREADGIKALDAYSDLVALGTGLEKTDPKASEKYLSLAADTAEGRKNLALQLDLAKRAEKSGNAAAAKARFELVFALDAKNEAAARFLAKANGGAAAQPYLEALANAGSKDVEVYKSLAAIAEGKNDAKRAAELLGRAAKLAPKDAELSLSHGRMLAKSGDAKSAAAATELAWAGKAKLGAADLGLLLDSRTKANREAADVAQALLAIDAAHGLANKLVGESLFKNEKTRGKALVNLERGAELAKNDAAYAFKVAQAALAAKNGERAERWLSATLKLDPRHEEANLRLGEAVLAKGDVAQAVKLLAEAGKARPKDERLHRVLAEAYGKLGDKKKQEDELKLVVGLAPKDAEANGALGKLMFERGARSAAREYLAIGQKARPDDPTLTLPLAELELERGDSKTASDLAVRALKRNAKEPRALRVAGLSFHKLQNHKDAVKYLSQLAAADSETNAALGRSRVALNDLAGAQAPLAAAVAALPKDAALGALYTSTLVRLEKYAEATKAGESAIKAGANDPSLLAAVGYSYYRMGDPKRSNQLITQAEARGAKESYIPLVKGENYFKSNDLPAAKAAFEEALKRDPKSGPANFYLGKIAFAQKDMKRAAEHLGRTVQEAPGNLEAQELLGRASLALNDFKTAKGALEKVPMAGKAELLCLRGQAQSGADDARAAEKSFKEALDADPNYFPAVVARGDNYLKLPHWDRAKELYEQAGKLAPTNPEPVAKLAKLHAEMGDVAEAEKAQKRVEKIELQAAEERRKRAKPEEIVQVGIGNFVNNSPSKDFGELGIVIAEELTAEFSRIGKIEVLDRVSLAQQLEAANELAKLDEAVGLEAIDRLQGKIKGMKMAVVGSYLVEGDNIRITAKIVDESSRIKKASVQAGLLTDRGAVQRKVALELAGEAVPLEEADRRALSRPASTSDLGVAGKLAAAREAELAGDVRAARALYQEALAMDASNEDLIKKVKANESRLKERNRLAVGEFRLAGATLTEPWVKELGVSITDQVGTKLAASGSISLVEDPMVHEIFQQEHNLIVQEIEAGSASSGSGMVLEVGGMSAKNEAELEKLYEKMKENLKVNVMVSGRYAISGDRVSIAAKLHDTEAKKDLLTVTEEGNLKELIDVENRLSEKLLRALLGTPTEEEVAKMRAAQEFKDFQAYMASLKDKSKPVEVAKAPEPPPPPKVEEKKPEPPPPPPKVAEKKPEVAAAAPKPEPDDDSKTQEDRFQLGYRLETWLIESDRLPGQTEYGPAFMHGVNWGWDYDRARNNFIFAFLKNGSSDGLQLDASGNAEFSTLRMWEVAWEGDFKLLSGDPFINFYLGIQLGLIWLDETPIIAGQNGWTSDDGQKLVLFGDGHAGVALNPFSWITLYGQAGYTYPTSDLPIQGVTLSAGAGFRL
ncbi:MAG: tetratricopeptide repeat protein [Deltaproteobacteria bacterium]|nr:tetratricopeptide repeat protein [Deltaproteobacteria bacterium]